MNTETDIKQNVREFYDQVGWQQVSEGVYQNARYEDLRPVSRDYIHKCHMRVKNHLPDHGRFLLDAGSGPIQYPEYLYYSDGYDYRVCADISIQALTEARKRIGDHGLMVVADVANLPFCSEAFDGIVSLHTIHHLPLAEHPQAYHDLYRVLKSEGSAAVVNGWHKPPLGVALDRLRKFTLRLRGFINRRIFRKTQVSEGNLAQSAQLANDAKSTFVEKNDADWLKRTVGSQMPLEILVWRSVSVKVLRTFIHDGWGGRGILRFLFWLEERFPHWFGENGQYPLVVIQKNQKKVSDFRLGAIMDWKNQKILVTGGTGSFGKKFIRVLLDEYSPEKLIVYSRDELKQHEMRSSGFDHPNLRYFIGDVRDQPRLKRAMQDIDIVVHAAALKQVPACEYNPMEAVKTNILGTSNVVDASIDARVKKVLFLSTDKAVTPVNLYGATKLTAEKLVVASNAYAGDMQTRLSCVRYGNVVGSRGSVVPIFIRQRENGNRLTITDKRMTRFWLSLEQGVRFVISNIERMHGGEVFVPKIPSTKIIDLARVIAPQAEIKVIGIRPGEKLHEMMISRDESRSTIELEDRFVVEPFGHLWFRHNWEDEGKRVPDGFKYTSDNNSEWLTVEQIRQLVQPFEE